MIASFKDKRLEDAFIEGKSRRLPQQLLKRILARLDALHRARALTDLPKSYRLHQYPDDGRWSIDVNGPWRILFRWGRDDNAYDVEYNQPH
jgi:toxin HigB-1